MEAVMTTATVWKPTEAQVKFVRDLLEQHVSEADRPNWLQHIRREITSNDRLSALIGTLKSLPYLPEYAPPTEEGLYRNPQTGELYRITRLNGWTLIVSKYSKVATSALRLTEAGEVVKVEKGTWKKLNQWAPRQMLTKMRANWKMTKEDMIRYQYGICLFCYRGLKDARSVKHNYGPECAKREGLPWGGTMRV
jgi:hypothetical protein